MIQICVTTKIYKKFNLFPAPGNALVSTHKFKKYFILKIVDYQYNFCTYFLPQLKEYILGSITFLIKETRSL